MAVPMPTTIGSITLRRATRDDAALLFRWANDPVVRANSFSTAAISWPEHVAWLERRLSRPEACFMVVGDDATRGPVGQVRFDITARQAVLSVSVDAEFRGQGIGAMLIALATRELLADRQVSEILAFTRPENLASQHALRHAGFIAAGNTEIRGQVASVWRYAGTAKR